MPAAASQKKDVSAAAGRTVRCAVNVRARPDLCRPVVERAAFRCVGGSPDNNHVDPLSDVEERPPSPATTASRPVSADDGNSGGQQLRRPRGRPPGSGAASAFSAVPAAAASSNNGKSQQQQQQQQSQAPSAKQQQCQDDSGEQPVKVSRCEKTPTPCSAVMFQVRDSLNAAKQAVAQSYEATARAVRMLLEYVDGNKILTGAQDALFRFKLTEALHDMWMSFDHTENFIQETEHAVFQYEKERVHHPLGPGCHGKQRK